MFNSKKGNVYVIGIITITILAIFVANVLIPQVKSSTNQFDASKSIVKINATVAQNYQLTNNVVTSSLSIAGLTLTNNYTINYNTGILTLNNATANNTYTAVYKYTNSNYLDDSGHRSLYAVIILASIVGILYTLFRLFGIA